MDTVSVTFEIPKEVIGDVSDLSQYCYEKLVLGLYLDDEVSLGKAAKLLDMSYDEFIQFIGKKKVPYFRLTEDQIRQELKILEEI